VTDKTIGFCPGFLWGRVSSRPLVALAGLSLLLILAPMVEGQVPAPCALQLAALQPGVPQQPGTTARYEVSATAPNLGGQVTFTVAATGGWTATVDPAQATVAGQGGEARTTVAVSAPSSGGTAAPTVTVQGTLTCASPVPGVPVGQPATAEATLNPTLAAPPSNLGPGAGLGGTTLLLAGGVAVIALCGGAVLALRPRALSIAAEEPKRDIPPGGGASFPITVTNRTKQQLTATLDVGELPVGWRLVAPPREVRLEPGTSETLQLLVRSPDAARPGDAALFEVRARAGAERKPAAVMLQAFVVGENSEGDSEDEPMTGGRPDVIVRDEKTLERGKR
jgi:hypothetical protein